MHIINLALKDLLQIIRDWKAAFFLFAMPIAFTLVFGFVFGGTASDGIDEDPRISVGIVDQDNRHLSKILFNLIDTSDSIRPERLTGELTMDVMKKMVENGEIAAVIIIPTGYSMAYQTEDKEQLIAIFKPETASGAAVQQSLQVVLSRLNQSISAANFSTKAYEQYGTFGDTESRQRYFEDGLTLATLSWEAPPLELVSTHTSSKQNQGVEETTNAFTQSSPGMMVQFALAGLIGAAEVLVLERKSGSLRRLLTTAISRTEILLGHFTAMFMMIFVQFVSLITFAQIFLKVPYFSAPFATFLITFSTTLFAASLGLLIGTLSKNSDQVIMFSLIPMFIFSGLGGAWMPLEFTSESFQTIGHLTPLAWAMDGYQNIIIRGMGIESALFPSVILFGFAAVCFALAVWRFKFE